MAYKAKSFKDGSARIYKVENTKVPGERPKESVVLSEEKLRLRYNEKTVGITRKNLAMQKGNRADILIECLKRDDVQAQDVAILRDGKQYKIIDVQYPEDAKPPTMLITMERVGEMYDVPES
ncbi:hypothetical protein Q5O14_16295 [Eubacteriaceae bacterium ES2]|nr:hypothetical protein Q5O14_16295 [Eubacteriaceae bacterium ES2]